MKDLIVFILLGFELFRLLFLMNVTLFYKCCLFGSLIFSIIAFVIEKTKKNSIFETKLKKIIFIE